MRKRRGKLSAAGIVGIAVLVIVLGGLFIGVGQYNSLVSLNEEVDNQWGQVETVLQRRFDLIPNLVNAVKGSMKQEKEVFGNIADARAKMAGAKSQEEKVQASGELEGALGRLLVVMENYPQLQSNQNVTNLMDELAGTENRIAVERQRYNKIVTVYNKKVKRFPTNIFANMLGFEEKEHFAAQEGAQNAPKVNF